MKNAARPMSPWIRCGLASLLAVCCLFASTHGAPCPAPLPTDLSSLTVRADASEASFSPPLDAAVGSAASRLTNFATRGTAYAYTGKYHAAEDFECPAGTPVYAGADGRISFSGAMAGYGWLIAIDHPAANAYTLYGHLSPSQWHRELGAVGKGDLIGYIGGTFENGTSVRYGRIPPHLHFAIRAGQRSDYPGIGEWRWQAGWVKACPQDLGWLQPSAVLASQAFPIGGSVQLDSALLERFASELLVVGIFLSSAACGLIWARRRTKPHLVLFFGTVLVVGGWLASRRGMTLATVILATGAVLIAVGVFALARHGARSKPGPVD